jgi:CRP/FNR family transcriptional regulator, cyclic AMP receptor protein
MAAMAEFAEHADALRRVPFFQDLSEGDLRRLAEIGRIQRFDGGRAIVEQGDQGDALFIITEGQAEVEVGGRVHTLKPGDFFGEMALISSRRRSATVTATEPLEALALDASSFKPFLLENPAVAVAILEGLVNRLREVQERIDAWIGS